MMEVKYLELRTNEEEKEVLRKSLQDGDKKKVPKLDLKPLPDYLKYVFLGQGDTHPVIILALLSNTECECHL